MLPRRGQLLRTDSTKLAMEEDADIGVAIAKRPSVRIEERHMILCNIDGNGLMRSRVSTFEGVNKSAISRVKGIAWGMVHRWIERAGESCRRFNDKILVGYELSELQANEIRTFVGGKQDVVCVFAGQRATRVERST